MDLSRREALASATAAALGAGRVQAGGDAAPVPAADLATSILWHDKPAASWPEAHPIGNGRLGCVVFGGIRRERLQLNEDRFWSGGPYTNLNPAAREALPRVRALIFAGRHAEAEALAQTQVQAVPQRNMSFQSLGDLFIDHLDVEETTVEQSAYRRELDLDAAVSLVRFTGNGPTVTREVFSSAADQVIAVRIDLGGAPISLDCSFGTGQPATTAAEGPDTLVLRGHNGAEHGIAGGLRFAVRLRAMAEGGSVRHDGPVLHIRGARSVVLLLAAATSHVSPLDTTGDPDAVVRAQIAAASAKPFAHVLRDHQAEHRRLFRRVSVDLGVSPAPDRPTDQRAALSVAKDDPALMALFFQLGRYLLLSSSRGRGEPANLQGLWNESNRPPWGSKYTININTQMNYWPVDTANLPECTEPLVAMCEELALSGAQTARQMYGARGWVAHHNTDLWRASGPVDNARTGLWPMGGAWLSVQLWDHWDFSRDRAFLRRIYPLLKGAALFFLDALVKDPATGFMVTCPSLSPENDHGHGSTLCAGPAMDMQILRDLFARTVAAGRELGLDADLRPQLSAMRDRLAPHRIGKNGQLQEWQADWDADAVEQAHRHTSHLYALFPSGQINLDDTPELAAAARRSLELRGPEAQGWSLAWRASLWAHLREGERAHAMLRRMLAPVKNYRGLPGIQPPFQIDNFFGGTAAVVEMILQSRGDAIHLLPALPTAWRNGHLRGVRARGGVTLDIVWREGRLVEAVLYPASDGACRIRVGQGALRPVRLRAGRCLRLTIADLA